MVNVHEWFLHKIQDGKIANCFLFYKHDKPWHKTVNLINTRFSIVYMWWHVRQMWPTQSVMSSSNLCFKLKNGELQSSLTAPVGLAIDSYLPIEWGASSRSSGAWPPYETTTSYCTTEARFRYREPKPRPSFAIFIGANFFFRNGNFRFSHDSDFVQR